MSLQRVHGYDHVVTAQRLQRPDAVVVEHRAAVLPGGRPQPERLQRDVPR
ncbi:hypothetical protein [Saccharothrix carnea]|nr:hypothetical protein [Saccharothrix carnea]